MGLVLIVMCGDGVRATRCAVTYFDLPQSAASSSFIRWGQEAA